MPIDDGKVSQALVRYTRPRLGTMTYRGPVSHREYRFSAGPGEHTQYVLEEDLPHFDSLVDFEVLAEGRIDAPAEAVKRLKEEIADSVRRELQTELATHRNRPRSRRAGPGRPPGHGFGALLDCLTECSGLAERLGSIEEAYDSIAEAVRGHPGWYPAPPPRERYPAVRSDAKRRRLAAGRCPWHRHPEPWPPAY